MMTITELAAKAADIQAKYTDKGTYSVSVRFNSFNNAILYSITHNGDGNSCDTGYGTTNIKNLLTKFELAMHGLYRLNSELTDDIVIDQ